MNEKLELGAYYVSVIDERLRHSNTKSDCSDLIKNFDPFAKLGIDLYADVITLIQNPVDNNYIFISYPVSENNVNRYVSLEEIMTK